MKTRLGHIYLFYRRVLEESIAKFFREDVLTQSAALSFYMIFSLPSILLIILWTAARFYREVAVQEALFTEIGDLVGHEGAQQLMATVEGLDIQEPTWWATAVGVGVLIFTATTVLVTMQNVLNRIFEVKPAEAEGLELWEILRDRLISFTMLATMTFILLVSLVVDTLITALGKFVTEWIGSVATYVVAFDSILLDLAGTTVLFAMFFRYLPDVKLTWRDTWLGAVVTTVLFTAGKYLIGFFIGNSSAANLYEAAGSLLVLMLWVYYASAIFLFGATFTFVRAKLLHVQTTGMEVAQDMASNKSPFTVN
jgi:membrane protein